MPLSKNSFFYFIYSIILGCLLCVIISSVLVALDFLTSEILMQTAALSMISFFIARKISGYGISYLNPLIFIVSHLFICLLIRFIPQYLNLFDNGFYNRAINDPNSSYSSVLFGVSFVVIHSMYLFLIKKITSQEGV